MATTDWAKLAADAAEAGIAEEQAEIDTAIAAVETKAAKEIADFVKNKTKKTARTTRLIGSGLIEAEADDDSEPEPSVQQVREATPAPVAPVPTIVQVEATPPVEPAPADPTPAVVAEPAASEPEHFVTQVAARQEQLDRNPRHWDGSQKLAAFALAFVGLVIGVMVFMGLGDWITNFRQFWALVFVSIFTVAGFYIGGYWGMHFRNHSNGEVATD